MITQGWQVGATAQPGGSLRLGLIHAGIVRAPDLVTGRVPDLANADHGVLAGDAKLAHEVHRHLAVAFTAAGQGHVAFTGSRLSPATNGTLLVMFGATGSGSFYLAQDIGGTAVGARAYLQTNTFRLMTNAQDTQVGSVVDYKGGWHVYACTFGAAGKHLYVDGALFASQAGATQAASDGEGPTYWGRWPAAYSTLSMAAAMAWNRVLTAAEHLQVARWLLYRMQRRS